MSGSSGASPIAIATALLSAPPSAPYGTTQTVDVLGLSSATDGSAGNPVTRTYYCIQGGLYGTITDTYTYGTGSLINNLPVRIVRAPHSPIRPWRKRRSR